MTMISLGNGSKVYKKFIVTPSKFKLKDLDPGWPSDTKLSNKELKAQSQEYLEEGVAALSEAQELLYASGTWSVLIIFQAMDAAGKDTTIKHVMSGINPQGCQVTSFKHPSGEELSHDFLWRYAKALPERGKIGIFNRSYYEEVLVVRVHPELVAAQRVPGINPNDERVWRNRFRDINNFEKHLSENGTLILKFFLNLSKKEQKKRFMERLEEKDKHWKFSIGDVNERKHWKDYMFAYEDAIRCTSTDWAPWFVIPADRKWVSRAVVAKVISHAIQKLKLTYPPLDSAKKKEIAKALAMMGRETK